MTNQSKPYFPGTSERPNCARCERQNCWSRDKFQRGKREFSYTSGRCPRLPDLRGEMYPEDAELFRKIQEKT